MKKILNIIKKEKKIGLAYSGGIDSNILFSLVENIKKKIILIHINHNTKRSNLIENNCINFSKIKKIKIITSKIKIKKIEINKKGFESAARKKRYKKIIKIAKKEKIKLILLGHHLNDKIETFFLNMFRGSGVNGILSMKKKIIRKKITFLRPLIYCNREYLIKKFIKKKIKIISDPSNFDTSIRRNYIRKTLKKIYLKYPKKNILKFIKNIKNYKKSKKYVEINKKMKIPSKRWLNDLIKKSKNKGFLTKKKNKYIYNINSIIKVKKMKIVVHKYGGTSLGNYKIIKKNSKRIKKESKKKKIIVVVSAPNNLTNKLSKIFLKLNKKKNKYYDLTLSNGEQISAGLICGRLLKENVKVEYMPSWKIPIITNSKFSESEIIKIKTKKILNKLYYNDVLVIPGFQGINNKNEITILKKGGSDNTAINISYYLNAEKCYIYTDVMGIYACDPRKIKTKIIKKINYKEIIEMSSLGSKVMQLDSLISCYFKKVKTIILSSMIKGKGTKIVFKGGNKNIRAINTLNCIYAYKKTNIKEMNKIIKKINKKKIEIDNICFDKFFCFSFENKKKNIKFIKKIMNIKKNMCKLSIIGTGIKNYSRNFYKIIKIFLINKIKIKCLTTSEIKISMIIKKKNENIIKKIKEKFNL